LTFVTLEKVPTEDFLKRRNFHGPSRCVLCRQEEETVHHLLVHCLWASSLWQLGLSLLGVSWVQPGKVKEVLVAWRRKMKKSLASGVWKLIPLAIWWSVWKGFGVGRTAFSQRYGMRFPYLSDFSRSRPKPQSQPKPHFKSLVV